MILPDERAICAVDVRGGGPGTRETDALDAFANKEQMLRDARERTPAGRMVEARDIADAVLFLSGPGAQMICGQTIVVDGGFSLLI